MHRNPWKFLKFLLKIPDGAAEISNTIASVNNRKLITKVTYGYHHVDWRHYVKQKGAGQHSIWHKLCSW